jgi:hypothetical protein
MKPKNRIPVPAAAVLLRKLEKLVPAIKGSLSLVRKPCVRPRCLRCAEGSGHPAYMLSFTHAGKRRCLYVPKALVPLMRRALRNGRRIESLLYESGPALVREHRENQSAKPSPKRSLKASASTRPMKS